MFVYDIDLSVIQVIGSVDQFQNDRGLTVKLY